MAAPSVRDTPLRELGEQDSVDELAHYGIKGMRWGVRRSQEELDRLAGRKPRKSRSERRQERQEKRETKKAAKKQAADEKLKKTENDLVRAVQLERSILADTNTVVSSIDQYVKETEKPISGRARKALDNMRIDTDGRIQEHTEAMERRGRPFESVQSHYARQAKLSEVRAQKAANQAIKSHKTIKGNRDLHDVVVQLMIEESNPKVKESRLAGQKRRDTARAEAARAEQQRKQQNQEKAKASANKVQKFVAKEATKLATDIASSQFQKYGKEAYNVLLGDKIDDGFRKVLSKYSAREAKDILKKKK